MAQMLLINPAKRRTVKRSAAKKRRKNPSPAQRAARAKFAAMSRARSANPARKRARRRRNPVAVAVRRRRNPIGVSMARKMTRSYRRRNPIGMGGSLFNFRSYFATMKDAAVMGAGAVAMDVGYSYINRMLPAMLQRTPGSVTAGDAVKAVLTVMIGRLLAKPTRGLSQKAAMGALTVQAYNITASMLPASMPVNGLGWSNAGRVVPGGFGGGRTTQNGNRQAFNPQQLAMIQNGGVSPLLSGRGAGGVGMWTPGALTPLLSAAQRRR
jgi:hypothetical protein